MRERSDRQPPRGWARACLAGLLLCPLLLLVFTTAAASAQRLARPYALSYNLKLWGDNTDQDRQVQSVARSAESVRHPVLWDLVEPKKGKFKWKDYDSFVRRLARYRVRLEVVLGFSAPWARTTGHSGAPPANPSD